MDIVFENEMKMAIFHQIRNHRYNQRGGAIHHPYNNCILTRHLKTTKDIRIRLHKNLFPLRIHRNSNNSLDDPYFHKLRQTLLI